MTKKIPLNAEEKHELIGNIVLALPELCGYAREDNDDFVEQTCETIEEWLTELAFGREAD